MRGTRPMLTLLVSGAVLAGCGGDGRGGPSRGTGDDGSEELAISTAGWETDFSKHSVPLSEFSSGGPPRDGIPPVDDPKFVGQAEADRFLEEREPVLAVEAGGVVRAYPLQILIWHEIVNDRLGGRPIAVTYCPLCNSSVVFDRRVDGRTLTFGTTGNLRNSDLVMWDRQTESWWQQISAEGVVGELTGKTLKVLPAQQLSWREFRRLHPKGEVLSRDTGFDRDYGRNPYEGYDADRSPGLGVGRTDSRLPAKERVAAIRLGRRAVVYPFSRLRKAAPLNDRVGRREIVVFFERDVRSALDNEAISASRAVGASAVFERRLDGRTLTFGRDRGRSRFRDAETGSSWDMTGRAIDGPLTGRRLRRVNHDDQFWFAVAAFFKRPDIRR